jgi:hypothetical protein
VRAVSTGLEDELGCEDGERDWKMREGTGSYEG